MNRAVLLRLFVRPSNAGRRTRFPKLSIHLRRSGAHRLRGWRRNVALRSPLVRPSRSWRNSTRLSDADSPANCHAQDGRILVGHLESIVLPVPLQRQIPFVSLGEPIQILWLQRTPYKTRWQRTARNWARSKCGVGPSVESRNADEQIRQPGAVSLESRSTRPRRPMPPRCRSWSAD